MKNKKTAATATARGYDIITEGKAKIAVPKYSGKDVSSRMPVFYNPVMKSNRDITIILMAAAAKTHGIKKWKIDFENRNKVLQVDCYGVTAQKIIASIKAAGYECKEL